MKYCYTNGRSDLWANICCSGCSPLDKKIVKQDYYLLSVFIASTKCWSIWWRHLTHFSIISLMNKDQGMYCSLHLKKKIVCIHLSHVSVAMMTLSKGNIFRVTGPLRGNSPSFDVFFNVHLNKRLSKQSWGWWFEISSCLLWHHCNDLTEFPEPLFYSNLAFHQMIKCPYIHLSIGIQSWHADMKILSQIVFVLVYFGSSTYSYIMQHSACLMCLPDVN